MEVCNQMHIKVRYVKFVLDEDNDLNLEYDPPQLISDDCVGEVAVEMMIHIARIMDENYSAFMKALYV